MAAVDDASSRDDVKKSVISPQNEQIDNKMNIELGQNVSADAEVNSKKTERPKANDNGPVTGESDPASVAVPPRRRTTSRTSTSSDTNKSDHDQSGRCGAANQSDALDKQAKMRDLFMADPMMKQVEKQARKNISMLNNIQQKWDQERAEMHQSERSQHIPGPLQGKGKTVGDILRHLEDLIVYENYSDKENTGAKLVKTLFKKMDEDAEVAVVSHTIGAYISMLNENHLQKLSTRILSDTKLWMSRLFRFKDSSAYFSCDESEGLVRVCRLALHHNYPKYATTGFEALYSQPPVIYISAAAYPGIGQHLCSQLGLPLSCLCVVPGKPTSDHQQKMDIDFLNKQIADDKNSGRIPSLLIACVGTPVIGDVDRIKVLQDVCKTHNIWLHLEGNTLATLTWFSVPTAVMPAATCDSMTVHLGTWLSLPAIPYATIFRQTDAANVHLAGLSSYTIKNKLDCIPLWVCLQTIGHEGIVERIKHCIELAAILVEKLRWIPTIEILKGKLEKPDDLKDSDDDEMTFTSLIAKAVNALRVFEIASPTVVFRYRKHVTKSDGQNSAIVDDQHLSRYYNALNRWLVDTLNRENANVNLTAVDVENVGICLRFASLETVQANGTTKDHILDFVKCFHHQIEILDATLRERENFHQIVAGHDNVRVVDLPDWAGLGAIQYIPNEWTPLIDNLPSHGVQEINSLNHDLLTELQSNDNAFCLGISSDGLKCIRFGLITPATDVEELVALVCSIGKKVEESSKALEKMTEMIKKGIEEANKDLEKEQEDKLLQEGLLRQVPLVGSIVSWLSPPPKDTSKGRTFNLQSGKIESTEEIYKHHMQILSDTKSTADKIAKAKLKPKRKLYEDGDKTAPQLNGDVAHSETTDSVASIENNKSPTDKVAVEVGTDVAAETGGEQK
ncbi:pyridoxal-dependent decarboxylase domain-containing protein 1-like [Tubulanus polymorphus]|uniref:pyridoxal-dependent decarboxylase domain-containing protein 1-like n=1 Tax=Tubulanus polymorphus TaxID=672921 RepID=UPI003DA50FCD